MTPQSLRRPLFVLCLAFALAAPASAMATDRFVDKDTGLDSGNCSTQANPCASPAYAGGQVTGADVIKVDDSATPYLGNAVLTLGASMVGFEFVGGNEGEVILDGGGSFTIQVGSGAVGGTISGMTLRSSNAAVRVDGTLSTITNNVFDSGGPSQVDIDLNDSSTTVSQNTFSDLNTTVADRGITVDGASPTIIDNDFTNQAIAIDIGNNVTASNVNVQENQITGTHAAPFINGYGVLIASSSDVVLEDNVVTSGSVTSQAGVSIGPGNNTDAPILEMRRNQIYGYETGVFISDTSVASLKGDVIAGSATQAMVLSNSPNPPGSAATTMKNVTLASAGAATSEVFSVEASLTIDSSILGDAGIATSGASACTITRSRGPVTTPGGNGCTNFQTAAAPNFVNPGANNYHLTSNNPTLIDQGDPLVSIAPDNLDIDLQKRSIDGDGNCSEVRDLGADEFLPAAPTANITAGPADGSTITTATTQFSFTNSNSCPGATLQCSLDGAVFSTCTSPANLGPLAEGAHTFAVRALDLVPQAGPTASRSFTVDLPSAAPPPPAQRKCPKGKKLKKGRCVKKKRKK